MIFDSLTHVTPDGRWFGTPHDSSELRLLREMDASGTERAVVVALAGYIPNDYVAAVCARHQDRLVPCGGFNPATHADADAAVVAFRQEFHGNQFRAVKLHPRLNGYDPLDARCLAVLGELAIWRQRLPVWIDTLFFKPGLLLSRPLVETVRELVIKFPEVTFVLLHGGGSSVLQVADAIQGCDNAFLDLSFTATRYAGSSVEQDLRYLLHNFDRHIVFGSDFPEVGLVQARDNFSRLADGLAADKLANVSGQNLRAILFPEQP